eukprot:PLAT12686.1.p2 GENE.PLAT12686.1~~PLAT12686.1.p2  ORF type:complete len:132 (+),score=61.08 PLAT12686.1:41-436(+)
MAEYDDAAMDAARLESLSARERDVDSLLRAGNGPAAVSAALADPPFRTKRQDIKDRNAALVARAIAAVRDDEMPRIVDGMSEEEIDVLMKYIYRGLGDLENCASLLKWHEKALEKGGLGSIVRAFTERRTA